MRIVLAILTLMIVSIPVRADEVPDNLKGTWKVVRAERNGQIFPAEVVQGMVVIVQGPRMVIKDQRRTEIASIEVDTTKEPKHLQMTPVDENGPPAVPAEGIFDVQGTTLRLCWAKNGRARPTEFLTRIRSDTVYLLLERESK